MLGGSQCVSGTTTRILPQGTRQCPYDYPPSSHFAHLKYSQQVLAMKHQCTSEFSCGNFAKNLVASNENNLDGSVNSMFFSAKSRRVWETYPARNDTRNFANGSTVRELVQQLPVGKCLDGLSKKVFVQSSMSVVTPQRGNVQQIPGSEEKVVDFDSVSLCLGNFIEK